LYPYILKGLYLSSYRTVRRGESKRPIHVDIKDIKDVIINLNTQDAMVFTGFSKMTLLKYIKLQKIPHSIQIQNGKNKKFYRLEDLERICIDTSPRLLPDKETPILAVRNEIASFDPTTIGGAIFNEVLGEFKNQESKQVIQVCQSIAFTYAVVNHIQSAVVLNPLDKDLGALLKTYAVMQDSLDKQKQRILDVQSR
jgi:hypothetical protein